MTLYHQDTHCTRHDILIDHGRRSVTAEGRELELTYAEFEILARLAARPLQVHSRHQLLTAVHGVSTAGGRTVDVHIARLRGKLGPRLREVIRTVRKVGYAYDPSRAAAA
ncbi:winged helix-turn-helix domain-containing protein [Streptomyces orinoci]|uniref:Winged helix-turn-helix domain-containing protein n=1 Tax=Streptomyces orinoci TaxID=67339 RepID=A0ABV3K1I0_STRON|nr:winged helix-turn-helix domain-containing protein [Streptomyces orinoci]